MWVFALQLMMGSDDKITRLQPQSEGNEEEEEHMVLGLFVWHFVNARARPRMELVWRPI